MKSDRDYSRRSFIKSGTAGVGAAALSSALAPASLGARILGSNDRNRMGFIGVGNRGSTHLRTILGHSDVEVAWVCDLIDERVERAAAKVEETTGSKPSRTLDYKEVLNAKDVDAILIAVPCDVHARLYLDTIAAGKDLYAEKPMCITVEDCDAVVKAAENSKSIVQVGFQRRYSPRIRQGMERIHAGDLGEVIEVRSGFLAHFGPLRGWFSKRKRSGDWMLEQAVHYFDLMNWALGGLPTRAVGTARQDIFNSGEPGRDVSDYYTSIIHYPNKVIVDWLHSWLCPRKGNFNRNYIQVMGRKGGMDLENGRIEYFEGDRTDELKEEGGNLTRLAQEAFLECVRTRKKPFSTVYNGRDAVLVGLLVRKAVYTERYVGMNEIR